jgi:hypothetical protein
MKLTILVPTDSTEHIRTIAIHSGLVSGNLLEVLAPDVLKISEKILGLCTDGSIKEHK